MSGKVGSFKIIFLIILAGFPGKCLPSKIPYFNKVLSKNLDYPRNPSKVLDDGGREEDYSEDFVDIDMEAFAEIFGDDDAGESEEKDEAGRIIGGHEAARGQFPFVVGLWRKRGSRPFCGGSLITSR